MEATSKALMTDSPYKTTNTILTGDYFAQLQSFSGLHTELEFNKIKGN